jgi:acyl-CoA thioester hydrolase
MEKNENPAQYPQSSIERIVEWVDTDASGHQHNSVILRWVEAAEAELFRRLGLPDYFSSAPRVQQVINYKAKLWFGQRVTAAVRIDSVGRTSLTMTFEVHGHPHLRSDGGIAATGRVTVAHVPSNSSRAVPWTPAFHHAIRHYIAGDLDSIEAEDRMHRN